MNRIEKIRVCKIIIILIASSYIIFSQNITVFGAEDDYSSYLESFDLSSFELLESDTKNFLDELGLSDFDYSSLADISFAKVINHIISTFADSSEGPLKAGITLIAFTILISFYSSFGGKLTGSTDLNTLTMACNMIIAIFIVSKISLTFSLCVTTIKLCADFTYAFFTAFCLIVATSGGAVTSFSTNTLLLVLSQSLNIISKNIILPTVNCFMCIGICSSVNKELRLGSLVASIKRIITTSISLLSTGFVTVLSLKTAVASNADALGLRSIRFAVTSVVPVIGNSISEGMLSIQSYSSLIKTSVGIVGIIAVFSTFLPAIAEVTIWRIILSLSSLCTQIFRADYCTDTINVFKDAMLILNVILILSMVTTIISIGVLIASKTGA